MSDLSSAHRIWGCFALMLGAVFAGPAAFSQDEAAKPEPKPPIVQIPPLLPADMEHIKLELDVDVAEEHVDGIATLTMTTLRRCNAVRLDAVDFETSAVRVGVGGGEPQDAPYTNDGKTIEIPFDPALQRGQKLTIVIDYGLDHPSSGLHFYAPTDDDPDAPYQMWSQGQTFHNRHWVPCFDHPCERQTTEIMVTADQKFRTLSNGRMIGSTQEGDRVTHHWVQDKPHSSYLMTLVVGEFAVKEDRWRGKPVTYYVPPDRADQIENSFGNTLRMLDCFTEKTGVPYPWDQYAQVCCYQFGGGMENTSATTLGEGTLHDARAHLDESSDWLVAHELGHQWFGDLVTCRDWSHTWLNEGFATYSEALWAECDKGADEYAWIMHEKSGSAIEGGKDHPIVYRGYENAWEQFDSRAYPKGAWVVHMLRCRLGDELFWKGVNQYLKKYAYQVVETDDLRQELEDVSGLNLERFFYDWTGRPGNPVLDVTCSWEEAEKTAVVIVKQTQDSEAFHFPLRLDFHVGQREPVIVQHDLTEKEVTYRIPLPARPTMFLVDPGNTVLMERTEHKDHDLWLAQLRHDSDPIGRLRAARELGKDKSDENRAAFVAALGSEKFWAVKREIADQLGDFRGNEVRDALLAGLDDSDPRIRATCASGLGKLEAEPVIVARLRAIVEQGDPSMRVESAAIRAYARCKPDDLLETLKPVLARDSFEDRIRRAAIDALGEVDGVEALELLTGWALPQQPAECRRAAMRAIREAVERQELVGEPVRQAVEAIAGNLTGTDGRTRAIAARTLGEFGGAAAPAIVQLRQVAADDENRRVREAAERSIDAIEKEWTIEDQLADLQYELARLRTENQSLRSRLDALESGHPQPAHAREGGAAAPAGTKAAASSHSN